MKPKWVNGISYYCRLLYKTNQNILRLIDLSAYSQTEIFKAEDLIYEICDALNILIPYQVDNDEEVYIPKNKRYYGILNFENDLAFLHDDIQKIIEKNKDSLYIIKNIRNKREHEAFNISAKSFYSGNDLPIIVYFEYQGKRFGIESSNFLEIIKDINKIFDKIIYEFNTFAKNNIDNFGENPYYRKYGKLNFERFNNIYNSNVLKDCSRAMIDF